MKQLVAVDPACLAKTEWEEIDGAIVIRNAQDAAPIVEDNKRLLAEGGDGYSRSRNLRRVASIPLVLWLDLGKKGILRDRRRLRAWLNDPDNRFFRTAPGRI
jgi:hypothetical protein